MDCHFGTSQESRLWLVTVYVLLCSYEDHRYANGEQGACDIKISHIRAILSQWHHVDCI